MEDIVAIIAVFGMAPLIVFLTGRRKLAERRLELEAKRPVAALPSADTAKLVEENRLLRERVENLESIVCSVDHDLNLKVAKLVDEQRAQLGSPGAAPTAPAANPALDRTATL